MLPPLALLLLSAPLCACMGPMQLNQTAPPCVAIVKATGLLAPTPGAPLAANDTVGEIAAFGVREAGQLDKANADKASAAATLAVCDEEWRKGLKAARPKKWWQIF